MKFRHSTTITAEKIELNMTPMIDVVFQLLAFFMFTLKIASVEGDFNIKMPRAAPSAATPEDLQLLPVRIRLIAKPDGSLAGIAMNGRAIPDFSALRENIVGYVGNAIGPNSNRENGEAELECDYNLRYEFTMDAITAVSGYIDQDNNVVKLVSKIKFAPPKNP